MNYDYARLFMLFFVFVFLDRSNELVGYISRMPSSAEIINAMDEISNTVRILRISMSFASSRKLMFERFRYAKWWILQNFADTHILTGFFPFINLTTCWIHGFFSFVLDDI